VLKIPRTIKILGWVSFFTDVSSEMILPILPLFLKKVLQSTMTSIGIIEGVAEATASLLKVASGWWSDRVNRRKPFVLSGYGLSTLVKPLLALTTSWTQVLGIRFLDRVGKGIRTSPRDALIADSAVQAQRGRSFGFHRMMDTMGAIVGTFIAFCLLAWKIEAYRMVFALSAVPGAVAVALILLFLREKTTEKPLNLNPTSKTNFFKFKFGHQFYFLIGIMVVFTFANISYAFFILRANDLGITAYLIPIIYMVYNLVYAALAMPFGSLSDKWGRANVLLTGIFMMGLLMLGFSLATTVIHAWLLFLFYGAISAVIETIPRAMVSDLVGSEHRASALGMYHTVVGLAALPASFVFGLIWQKLGAQVAFQYGAILCAITFLGLFLYRRKY